MMHGSLPVKLRVLRAQQGLTLAEAAERIGIGRDTLSDLEHGVRHPVLSTLAKIAEGYDVPLEDLLASESEPALAGASPKAEAPRAGQAPTQRSSAAEEAQERARTTADEVLEEVALGFSGAHEFEKHVARTATRVHFLMDEAKSALGELGDAKEYTERFGPELAERYQAYIDAVRVTTQEFDKDLRPLLLRMHADASEAERERQSPHTERTTNNG